MSNRHFWTLLGICITVSIVSGIVAGIYMASLAVAIVVWVVVECALISLLLGSALKMEDNHE